MTDLELRATIYDEFAATGRAPSVESLVRSTGDRSATVAAMRRLHDGHMIVLGDDGEVAMALPFSATPTGHVVTSGADSWWANCAWDAFAVVAATGRNAHISSRSIDDDEPVEIDITDGRLSTTSGFVHFAVPARHWWDDIVET